MQMKSLPLRHRVLRVIPKVAWVGLLLLLFLWLRVFYGSMEDYKTGETLLKENQTIRAVTYFDRSLHWYAPLNPYVERSAKRLWEIGERGEKEKDTRLALIAYESIRNGFYGASYLLTPGQDWIRRAQEKVDDLSTPQGRQKTVSSKKNPHPNPLWSAAVVVSFIGWVGSLLGFARWVMGRGGDGTGKMLGRPLFWIGLAILFFGLWILGMALA
jgi:hypothetical protein